MPEPLPIAVLISGGGTTLRNLIAKIREGKLKSEIRLVVSSNPAAKGLAFAKEAGIKTLVVEKKKELSDQQYCEATFGPCREAGAKSPYDLERADLAMVYGAYFFAFVLLTLAVGLLLACRSGRVDGSHGLDVAPIPR